MTQSIESAIEEWKPVVGYEGWYEVSSFGRVKRVAGGSSTAIIGRILRPIMYQDGYYRVSLSVGGLVKITKIHHLVMRAFVSTRPKGYQINHKDGVKTNNRLENLEYVTASHNAQHAWALGLKSVTYQKLNEDIVRELKRRKGSKSQRELALEFKISQSLVSMIFQGQIKIWAGVGE